MPDSEKKLKRAVIKEELVALTGEWLQALILQQFLYWGERVSDFDAFILEERLRRNEPNLELTHGWIWKSARNLKDEIMVTPLSEDTVRRHMAELVKAGWLEERNNPYHKWDRTLQYRPSIRRIQKDLQDLGYALEHYSLLIEDLPIPHGAESNTQSAVSYTPGAESNLDGAGAIPETTTEITVETTTEGPAQKNAPPVPATGKRVEFIFNERSQTTLEEMAGVALQPPARDYLTDVFNGHTKGLQSGVSDPAQDIEHYMQTADEWLKVYHKRTGLWAETHVQKPAIRELACQPGADLSLWDRVVTAWVKHGWNKTNVAGMIECYERGEIPTTGNKNGGKPHANTNQTSARGRQLHSDTLSDEQRRILTGL